MRMRVRAAVVLAVVAVVVPVVAVAPTAAADPPPPVIGGSNAPLGMWPDIAAVLTGTTTDTQDCTGTLVAPTVVLTAGHCYLTSEGPLATNVQIGTNSLATGGETIAIKQGIVYPNSQQSIDVTVLVLAKAVDASVAAPRAIATGWARVDIVNGASVEIAGYGSTDQNGSDYPTIEQEAKTIITDFDCSTSDGCNAAAKPDGELGAGGSGIDTCPGDSGGPLYLLTSYGTFLAGVTSRGYGNATAECGGGGVYERPDKIVSWIEQVAGVPVTHGPEPTADAITADAGGPGQTVITANDPKSTSHSYAVKTQPMNGTAAVRDDGTVRVCANAGIVGTDSVTVTVTDTTATTRTADIIIPITIDDSSASGTCSATAFGDDTGGGGCCDSGHGAPGTAIPLGVGLALLLRRRRMR